MGHMRVCIIVLAWSVLSTDTAFADSDAYFCASRGYLAFETRSGTPGKHELHIVRFGAAGISAPAPIALDDFQVHGMTCRAGQIEIQGWDRASTVDITNAAKPAITSRVQAYNASQSRPAENLGHLAKPQVIDLEADGANRFQLVIARVSKPLKGGIEHHTVTRIIQRASDRPGSTTRASRTLFEGIFLETVD